MRQLHSVGVGAALVFLALSAGCGSLLGLGDFTDAENGTGGQDSTSSGATGGGGANTTGQGGSGGSGGAEGCLPTTTQPCYSGPAGTQDFGTCLGGKQTCDDTGVWGACVGEVVPAPEDCSALGDEDCDGSACSETVWSKQFGDAEIQHSEDIAIAPDGGLLLAGLFTGSVNFGTIPTTSLVATSASDLFLASLDAQGEHVWSKSFGLAAGEFDGVGRLAVSSSRQIFMTGFYKTTIDLGGGPLNAGPIPDVFVASFDKDGNHLWSESFGLDAEVLISDLAVGPDGDPVAVGYHKGTIVLGADTLSAPNTRNAFAVKIDHIDGSVMWSRGYGDATGYPEGDQQGGALAIDNSNNIVFAGTTTSEVDLGLGFIDHSPDGGQDIFVVRLDGTGSTSWHTYFHGADDEMVSRIAIDATGSVYLAGLFGGTVSFEGTDFGPTKSTSAAADFDIFLSKLSSLGKHQWTLQLGDAASQGDIGLGSLGFDPTLDVAVDPSDNVVLAGGYRGTIQFGSFALTSKGDFDWFAAKLAPDGSPLWSRTAGSAASFQSVSAVRCDPTDGTIVLFGDNDGSLDIGPDAPFVSSGGIDVVLARLAP